MSSALVERLRQWQAMLWYEAFLAGKAAVSSTDGFIIFYVFLGILGGIGVVICLYKLAQTLSAEMKPKNKFGKTIRQSMDKKSP